MFWGSTPLNPPIRKGPRSKAPDASALKPPSQLVTGYHWEEFLKQVRKKSQTISQKNVKHKYLPYLKNYKWQKKETQLKPTELKKPFQNSAHLLGRNIFLSKLVKFRKTTSQNLKIGILFFSLVSVRCASFIKIWPLLRGHIRLHIVNWDSAEF